MKTLLVVHDVEQSINAIKPVIKLAKDFGAHLNIVLLDIMRSITLADSFGVSVTDYNEKNDEHIKEGERRARLVDQLLQRCKSVGRSDARMLGPGFD